MLPNQKREVLDHCNVNEQERKGQHVGVLAMSHQIILPWPGFRHGATYRLWGGGFVEVSHFVIMLRVSLGFRSRHHILLPPSHTMGEDLLKIVIISPRFSH
jgi:hypothetical protein